MTEDRIKSIFRKLWPDTTQLTFNSPSISQPIAQLQMKWSKASGITLSELDTKLLLELYFQEAARRMRAEAKVEKLTQRVKIIEGYRRIRTI